MRCVKIILFLVVLSLTNLSFSNAASIVLESTFDNKDEGWGIRGDGTHFTYHASGGNPGGFISAEDQGAGGSWFFVAPDTWAGDWTSYIGGILSFDLKLIFGDTNKYWSTVDVVIETEDIGNYAQWSSGIDPGLGTWTHYEVRISESNFEIVGNKTWNEILSNVTNLLIRGEHIFGLDTEGIDNIRVVDSLGMAEIIGTWDDGIWYWDFVASAWTQMTAAVTTGDIASGDFTGDGKADVASSWENYGLWYQDGATLAWKKVLGSAPDRVAAGDVTGDGHFEIIGTWRRGIRYRNVAASKWTKMTPYATDGDIAAGDFTGDGKADVASSWEDDGLWYQDGATLAWTKIDSLPPFRVTAGDVTGDGRFEIIGTWDNGIWYWDLAASAWTQMTSYATDGDIAAGDFTGDGKADVASIWSDGLWYQDGATLAWKKISDSAPARVTAGDVTGK
jgi:hypothetical protein